MAVDVTGLDTELLKSEIKKTYARVSERPEEDFIFPTGRAWAEDLGYPPDLLANVPDAAADSFAGVANPFALGPLERGERVLDVGPGAGMDSLVAAQMVGPEGRASGVLAPGGRIQIADVTIENPVSEEGRRNIDLWTG